MQQSLSPWPQNPGSQLPSSDHNTPVASPGVPPPVQISQMSRARRVLRSRAPSSLSELKCSTSADCSDFERCHENSQRGNLLGRLSSIPLSPAHQGVFPMDTFVGPSPHPPCQDPQPEYDSVWQSVPPTEIDPLGLPVVNPETLSPPPVRQKNHSFVLYVDNKMFIRP